ncbi:MAG: M20/M25/M40 family metallo-hydrolase [Planctomycetes bacterium]|nr:M20/M25/M40 family metallo-hydrolase [Planctomycetota bacterium]
MKINRKRLITDLSRLVQIPSWQECDTIARHAVAALRDAGARNVHIDKAGNVIGTLGRGGKGLLLNAHLDTVPPGDYEGDPFSGKVSAGKLIGRGSSDDKAGVAAILEIVRYLAGRQLNQQITFALTVWEESTGPGENGAYQAARDCDAARCIVLENSMAATGKSMGVNIGCRGTMGLYVTVHGKACHAADPARGVNAVYRAARVIQALEKTFDPATMPRKTYKVWNSQVELGTLATVTEVEARQGINVIPAQCEIALNCRLLPDGDGSEIKRRMKRLATELPKGWISWSTKREIVGHLCEDHEFIAVCREAICESGMRTKCEIMGGRTDTTIFQHTGGIQSVIMGPGTLGAAHTKNEYMDIELLVKGTGAVLRTIEKMAVDG